MNLNDILKMFCEWCGYNFYDQDENFEGYKIYLTETEYLVGSYCSMNCCASQIISINKDVNKRLNFLHVYYRIYEDIKPARSPKELIKNGGNLSYDEYRKDFVYPFETSTYVYSSEEEYIDDVEDFDSDEI